MVPCFTSCRPLLGVGLFLCLAGCTTEDVKVITVPKDVSATLPLNPPPLEPPQTPALEPSSLAWDAPAGWQFKPGSGMRWCSYGVPGPAGEGDLSVVKLEGEAGGPLGNVNRWRGQLGLPPVEAEALAGLTRHVASAVGDVSYWEMSAPSSPGGLLGARVFFQGQSWFFKLTGPRATLRSAQADFVKLLASLRPSTS